MTGFQRQARHNGGRVRTPTQIVAIHRWLGVVLCLFMAAWFASGAVLMYVPFPALPAAERFARAGDVDVSAVSVTPAEAIRAIGSSPPITSVRLVDRLGRPLYVLQPRGSAVSAVWADDGSPAPLQSQEDIRRVAEHFAGAKVNRIDGPLDFDQWIVHQGFDSGRPYFRVQMDDDAGTVLYVCVRSGEVLQRTRRVERAWNYVGAVVHWIYPTVLRRNWAAWDQVVWWLSLAGISVVVIGIWLGIDRTAIALRRRKTQISLFRGWMKWHHVLGLCAFVFVFSWIFSGWLSMDHGRIFSMPDPTAEQVDRFRGMALVDAAEHVGLEFMRTLPAFRELDIKAVAATPLAIVRSDDGRRVYTVNSEPSYVGDSVPLPLIKAAVENAWPGSAVRHFGVVPGDDRYRQVRQSRLSESTVRAQLDDPRSTWVHVDANSAEIDSVMDRSRRVYRWLYHGLHSLDFPALVNRRPLWDVIMLSLLTLGFSFSVTGAVLGIRRLMRSVRSSRAVAS